MTEHEYASTLCQIAIVHVFKIPPRTTSGGHRATDWTEEVWEGKLSVIQKGAQCTIFLIDRNTNAEFARAPISEGAVERAVDSSRYFVLRCVNQNTQQKAFIGLAFNERNDAFEFNVALQDFDKFKKQEADLSKAPSFSNEPAVDMSLKNKITIKTTFGAAKSGGGASGGAASRRTTRQQGGDLIGTPTGGLLAPPKGDTPSRRQIEGSMGPSSSTDAGASFVGLVAHPDGTATAAPSPPLATDPYATAFAVKQAAPVAPLPSSLSGDPFAATLNQATSGISDPFGASPQPTPLPPLLSGDPFAATPSQAASGISDPFSSPAILASPSSADPFSEPVQAMSSLSIANSGPTSDPFATMVSSSPRQEGMGSGAAYSVDPFAGVSGRASALTAGGPSSSTAISSSDQFGSLGAINAAKISPYMANGVSNVAPVQQQHGYRPNVQDGIAPSGPVTNLGNFFAATPSVNEMTFESMKMSQHFNQGVSNYSPPMGMGAFDNISGETGAPNTSAAPQTQPQQSQTNSANLFDDLF
mmetsp:Transcript_40791/g.75510  ORF Transcript_40791/g.75510 Transcript_40791/m.75510 type:complete len:529 (+) Transcript_40791:97-1683(+)